MIPNYLDDVKAARALYPEEWAAAHVDGHPKKHDFIVKLARLLYAKDVRVGCNGKRGNPKELSMDALNILDPFDGPGWTPHGQRCWVVDVIVGAGGPNPQPTWNAFDDPEASKGAWVHPMGVMLEPEPPKPPAPVEKPYPGDAFFIEHVGVPLAADMALAGQSLNAGSAVWFSRTIWRYVHQGMSIEESTAKSRSEWRAILGLPPA